MLSKHAFDLVKVTEQAAISASAFVGLGDKNAADQAGVDAMRKMLGKMDIRGEVVIGEGEIDHAPMLYIGEIVGSGGENSSQIDIAVDPVEGTNLVARANNNSIAVIAIAPKGGFLHAPDMYMDKIAAGPEAVGTLSLDYSVAENLDLLAQKKGVQISDLVVAILDRDRHQNLIKEVRESGARIQLYPDGDVATAIATCNEDSGIDMILGIGGAPEGVLAAAALKAMGGFFQGRLQADSQEQIDRCKSMGIENLEQILQIKDLVRSDDCIFVASGITDGSFLDGVKKYGGSIQTSSVIMDTVEGIRFVDTIHPLQGE